MRTMAKRYCKNLNIKLVFSSFKLKSLVNVKDSVTRSFCSNVVCKFIGAECNSTYFGETSRHLSTRVWEHLFTDKDSNIFKHLRTFNKCQKALNDSSFTILNSANTYHHLQIKEAFHFMWQNPILNKKVKHFDILLNL